MKRLDLHGDVVALERPVAKLEALTELPAETRAERAPSETTRRIARRQLG